MNTILVTGGTGFVGSWVVKGLLEKGYTVRVALRNISKKEKYSHLLPFDQHNKLSFHEADLLIDGSYDEAAKGCDAIMHIASPFLLNFKDPQTELIDPALNGTRNVLSAASKSETVKKIVLTSSVAAIYGDNVDMKKKGLTEFTEEHFNTSSSLKHSPYSFSKTIAEKEAWKINEVQNQWDLVVINPSFVIGPPLSKVSLSGTFSFVGDILSGKFKTGAPDLTFGYVDVRDVANAHILALENENAKGRHILAERCEKILILTKSIENSFPKRFKLPKSNAPKFILLMLGWAFGVTYKFVKNNVGHPLKLNASKSKKELGLTYTDFDTTVKDMVDKMDELGMIK